MWKLLAEWSVRVLLTTREGLLEALGICSILELLLAVGTRVQSKKGRMSTEDEEEAGRWQPAVAGAIWVEDRGCGQAEESMKTGRMLALLEWQ